MVAQQDWRIQALVPGIADKRMYGKGIKLPVCLHVTADSYGVFTPEQNNDKTNVEPVHSYDCENTISVFLMIWEQLHKCITVDINEKEPW